MNNDSNTDGIDVCKVVLLGESYVGKTSIISRFVYDFFQENSITTTGASYATKNIRFKDYNNQTVKFEIWDTVGQEKYRSLTQIFYKDAAIAILVFDITKYKTFIEMKNYWYPQIKNYAPKDTIIGIAGHKCDLIVENEQFNENEVKDFANEIGAIFRYTSAKMCIGISELFLNLGCKYLDHDYIDPESRRPKTNIVGEIGDKRLSNNKNVNNNDKCQNRKQSVKLTKEKVNEKKKKWC